VSKDTPRHHYETARDTLKRKAEEGVLHDRDRQIVESYLDTYDKDVLTAPPPEGESTKAYSTLKNHCATVQNFTLRLPCDLHEATAEEINGLLDDYSKGTHPEVKNEGFAPNTVKTTAGIIRSVVEHADDLSVNKTDIVMPTGEGAKVDERDMYDEGEVQAMREATSNARDAALLDMLIYTGQRVRAIQSLRIKDVRPHEGATGVFYLNEDSDGLKGASGSRPLLGAQANVREWLDYHPCADDPDAALFCPLPSHPEAEKGEPIHRAHLSRRLTTIAEEAGVEGKPTNPHNFRHYFVTVCKRNYGLSDSEIKHLIGHRPDSTVMETTYAHLSDEEVAENVEVKAGYAEPDDASPLSPPQCPMCDTALPENARACPKCGRAFTPDAMNAKDEIEDTMYEGQRAADDDEEEIAVDDLRQALKNDPDLRAEVIAELAEQEGGE
jgi:integrase